MPALRPEIEAALDYARRSWAVFPVRENKTPATKHGFKDATHDADRIRHLWATLGTTGVAIRTGSESGLIVIDIDPDRGGSETLTELERRHGPLPDTVRSRTGGGGAHIYLRHPGGEVRCSAGKLGNGIDVRADGGYVVAPPSPHPSGERYEWEPGHGPDQIAVAAAPAWLLELLGNRTPSPTGPPDKDAIPAGVRNSTLMSRAGSMRRIGMSAEEIEGALLAVNRERCEPPLPEDEVAKIAASAVRYEPDVPGSAGDIVPVGLLKAFSARQITALPDPSETAELLGPLLVRGARTVLAAHTGEGKTTLSLHLAKAVVTGADFLDWRGTGARALVIDAEQGLRTVKRQLQDAGLGESEQVDYLRAPDGLALDEEEGQVMQVEAILEEGNYDLVVCDPLYKLHRGDSNEERHAVDLMRQLDRLRSRFGVALLLLVHLRKPPPIGAKFTIHEIFGSSAYLRGAEVVLGVRRLNSGYARLHFFKDRDGDLPVGEFWGLLFDREEGFRRDPEDGKRAETSVDKVRSILQANPGRTTAQLAEGAGCTDRTVRKVLGTLDAEFETGSHGTRLWRLPDRDEGADGP